eukprot:437710_1
MSVVLDKNKIIKEGWLQKKSKHLGEWRSRLLVLTTDYLFIYTQNDVTIDAKKIIKLSTVTVHSFSDTILQIKGQDNYLLKAATSSEKQQWMDIIHIYTNECVTIPIVVECDRDNDFNDNLVLTIPYNNNYRYTIPSIMTDVICYLQKKYAPFKFVVTIITSNSFFGQDLNYEDYDWNDSERNVCITDYDKQIIEQSGLSLKIDIAKYEHKTSGFDVACGNMKDENALCPIYAQMRYQDKFSENSLNHLYEYNHPITECKYGSECYAYKRLDEGGNDLKDRSHISIYRHPPRTRGFRGRERKLDDGINSFILNDEWAENVPIYHPTEEDKKQFIDNDGFLISFLQEIIDNGFKSDLCLTDQDEQNNNYTLLSVVEEKLKSKRHKLMGSPLNKSEMLSLLLYTGGESNYELCKSQRNGDYKTWKWFDFCLYHAIFKLSKRENGSYKLYTGLSSTKLVDNFVEIGYFKTYVSTSWVRQIAETFTDDSGMMFEIDEKFRQKAICCDVSWISKFGQTECEILIARCVDAELNCFECKIIDERNGIQIVSVRVFGDTKQRVIINEQKTQVLEYISMDPKDASTEIAKGTISDNLFTPKTFGLRRKEITKTKRDIVNIFISPIKRQLYSEIPLEVFEIICVLYEYPNDKNAQVTDGMSVSKNGKTFSNVSSSSTAYVNIPLHGNVNAFYMWRVYIDKLSSGTAFKKNKIIIGIQDLSVKFPHGFYGFDSFGDVYTNDIKTSQPEIGFDTLDYFFLSYDGRHGKLIKKRTKYSIDAEISFNIHCNYRLSITIQGKQNEISVIETTSSEIPESTWKQKQKSKVRSMLNSLNFLPIVRNFNPRYSSEDALQVTSTISLINDLLRRKQIKVAETRQFGDDIQILRSKKTLILCHVIPSKIINDEKFIFQFDLLFGPYQSVSIIDDYENKNDDDIFNQFDAVYYYYSLSVSENQIKTLHGTTVNEKKLGREYFPSKLYPTAPNPTHRNFKLENEMRVESGFLLLPDCPPGKSIFHRKADVNDLINYGTYLETLFSCAPLCIQEYIYEILAIDQTLQKLFEHKAAMKLQTLEQFMGTITSKIINPYKLTKKKGSFHTLYIAARHQENTKQNGNPHHCALKFEGDEYLLTVAWFDDPEQQDHGIFKCLLLPNTRLGRRVWWYWSEIDTQKIQFFTQRWEIIQKTYLKELSTYAIGRLLIRWLGTNDYAIYTVDQNNCQHFVMDFVSALDTLVAKQLCSLFGYKRFGYEIRMYEIRDILIDELKEIYQNQKEKETNNHITEEKYEIKSVGDNNFINLNAIILNHGLNIENFNACDRFFIENDKRRIIEYMYDNSEYVLFKWSEHFKIVEEYVNSPDNMDVETILEHIKSPINTPLMGQLSSKINSDEFIDMLASIFKDMYLELDELIETSCNENEKQ